MRGALVLGFALVGCINSDLVPCGDLACPADRVCGPSASCVFPEQLTVCVGDVDATACSYVGVANTSATAGACVGGVCLPLGCGNGVVTPDEVCDDGNNVNGDGCSADCKSTEVCGNGITDVATGEQCDDGNQDNLDGCRNDCMLPRCGDGIVDSFEECDPGSTVPLTATCIDLGYDFGSLTCSPSCLFDAKDSCQRFGWEFVHELDFQGKIAGDHGTLALLQHSTLDIEDAGVWTERDVGYVALDVLATTILAATASSADLRQQGTWSTLPAIPLAPGEAIFAARLADDGTPFVLAMSPTTCHVYRDDGSGWSNLPEPSPCGGLFAFATDNFAVSTPTTIEWNFPGGTRSWTTQGPVIDVTRTPTGPLAVYEYVGGTQVIDELVTPVGPTGPESSFITGGFGMVVVANGAVYAISTNPFDGIAYRGGYQRTEVFEGPPNINGAPRSLYHTRDGQLFAQGQGESLYLLGELATTQRVPPAETAVLTQVAATLAADGTFVVCGTQVNVSATNGWSQIAAPVASQCKAVWAASAIEIYATRTIGSETLQRWNAGTWTQPLLAGAAMDLVTLTGDATTGTVVGVLAGGGSIAIETGNVWTALALPAGCTAASIAMANGNVYVGGGCAGTANVWMVAGTTFTSLDAEPQLGSFASLYVAGDGTVFASAAPVVVIGQGAQWQRYPMIGRTLAGTSASDVYAVSGVAGDVLVHWNGTIWAQITLDSTLINDFVIAGPGDVAFLGAKFPSPTPMVWTGFVRGPP